MSAREFDEWQAFAMLEPIGDARGDAQISVLGAVIANQWRNEDAPVVTSFDIMKLLAWGDPKFEREWVERWLNETGSTEEVAATPVHHSIAQVTQAYASFQEYIAEQAEGVEDGE